MGLSSVAAPKGGRGSVSDAFSFGFREGSFGVSRWPLVRRLARPGATVFEHDGSIPLEMAICFFCHPALVQLIFRRLSKNNTP